MEPTVSDPAAPAQPCPHEHVVTALPHAHEGTCAACRCRMRLEWVPSEPAPPPTAPDPEPIGSEYAFTEGGALVSADRVTRWHPRFRRSVDTVRVDYVRADLFRALEERLETWCPVVALHDADHTIDVRSRHDGHSHHYVPRSSLTQLREQVAEQVREAIAAGHDAERVKWCKALDCPLGYEAEDAASDWQEDVERLRNAPSAAALPSSTTAAETGPQMPLRTWQKWLTPGVRLTECGAAEEGAVLFVREDGVAEHVRRAVESQRAKREAEWPTRLAEAEHRARIRTLQWLAGQLGLQGHHVAAVWVFGEGGRLSREHDADPTATPAEFEVVSFVNSLLALHAVGRTALEQAAEAALRFEPFSLLTADGRARAFSDWLHTRAAEWGAKAVRYKTHCLSRDCLRGSAAGDRLTALSRAETFDPDGCECRCRECERARTTQWATNIPLRPVQIDTVLGADPGRGGLAFSDLPPPEEPTE